MSSIREIAEQLVQRWEGNNPIDTADAADLAGAIEQALRDRDERAAKIAERPYSDEVGASGADLPSTVGEKIAAAIRED